MKVTQLLLKNALRCRWVFIFMLFVFLNEAWTQDSVVLINPLAPENGSILPDMRPSDIPFISHSLDSSVPAPARFIWNTRGNSRPLVYDVYLSEDSVFNSSGFVASGIIDTALAVWNLKINTEYYWKISGRDSLDSCWYSPVFSFKTYSAWPRMINIEGTTNVRDIGGQPVMDGSMISQGLLYRSAEFNQTFTVTQNGLQQLRSLGIKCEIDLRNSGENPQIVMPWLLRYLRPVNDDGNGMDSYINGLAQTQSTIKAVFKEIADKRNYPMIVHCRYGADRTGTIVALLEALLGCSELQMCRDYIWTSLSLVGLRDTASDEWRGAMYYLRSFDPQNVSVQLGAWNYLQVIGMSVAELINIRKIFINNDKIPYPILSVNDLSNFKHTARRSASWKCLTNSSKNTIVMGGDTRRMQLFDLSGRRIWEFSRNSSDKADIVKTPLFAPGAHILRSFKGAVGP